MMKKSFELTHVEYNSGDIVGFLCAGLSLAPVFAIVAYVSVLMARREFITFAALCGQLGNTALNVVLKHYINEPRPATTTLSGPGMPSNHAQFIFFTASFWALHILNKRVVTIANLPFLSSNSIRRLLVLLLLLFSSGVGFSRVYLGYHFPEQVYIGAAIGATTGSLWYFFVGNIAKPLFKNFFEKSYLCELFLLRDNSHIPDVLRKEYHFSFEYHDNKNTIHKVE